MVDPPDLDNHCALQNLTRHPLDDDLLLSTQRNRTLAHGPPTHSRRAHARFRTRPALVSLLLLLSLYALLLPGSLGRVVPVNDALRVERALSSTLASRSFASALEEGQAAMSNEQTDIFQRNRIYASPTTSNNGPSLTKRQESSPPAAESTCRCGKEELPVGRKIGFSFLAIILVLLSGVFAGLTLGYMSLDETQLQVLMTTGDEVQRARAAKIIPIRKDGHLLLTTLLIANMITNETLPIIFDPLLPNQVLSVVISTVLIVIFAELIPQSTCSRYGLQIGAYMAFPTRIIITVLWPIAYPVSRILHWVLGPHHGIVYRRAELKELVTMHATSGGRGGDLKRDTVMIVGGALDLQEKVVKEAMTPIDQVFMLPFSAVLDYPTLEKVVRSGHSRIPIYQEIEVQISTMRSGSSTPKKKLPLLSSFTRKASADDAKTGSPNLDGKEQASQRDGAGLRTVTRKKIVGTLLVKSCVLLDPEDAVPVSSMVINALPTVPGDEPLLNILNVFQEGRSHMAIVSPRARRGISDSTADLGSKANLYRSSQGPSLAPGASAAPRVDGLGLIDEEKHAEGAHRGTRSETSDSTDSSGKTRNSNSPKRRAIWSRAFGRGDGKGVLEQGVPSDATVSEKDIAEFVELKKWESHQSVSAHDEESGLPLGIITLEDVLEELLGEEILDEYDERGNEEQDFRTLMPPPSPEHGVRGSGNTSEKPTDAADAGEGEELHLPGATMDDATQTNIGMQTSPPPAKKTMLTRLGITRQRSLRSPSVSATPMTAPGEEGSSDEQTGERVSRAEVAFVMPSPVLASQEGGYFDGEIARAGQHPTRSSSVPPSADRQRAEGNIERSASRPPTPSGVTTHAHPPLYSPQPNRPVVIRTQAPGGAPTTTIANESLLRGRQTSQLPAAQTSASRSQTPAGGAGVVGAPATSNKGNRFKSQAAVGVGGSTVGATAMAPTRSKSQTPAVSHDVTPKDKDGHEDEPTKE